MGESPERQTSVREISSLPLLTRDPAASQFITGMIINDINNANNTIRCSTRLSFSFKTHSLVILAPLCECEILPPDAQWVN